MKVLGNFGRNLETIIINKGFKKSDFALKLGISNQTLTAIINNKGKLFSFNLLDEICFILEVPPGLLFSKDILK